MGLLSPCLERGMYANELLSPPVHRHLSVLFSRVRLQENLMFHWHASGCSWSSYSCLPGASLPARSSSQTRCSKKCAPLDCHPHQYPVTQTAAEVSYVKTADGSAICRWNLFQPETDFLQIRIRELLLKQIVPAMTCLLSPRFL